MKVRVEYTYHYDTFVEIDDRFKDAIIPDEQVPTEDWFNLIDNMDFVICQQLVSQGSHYPHIERVMTPDGDLIYKA